MYLSNIKKCVITFLVTLNHTENAKEILVFNPGRFGLRHLQHPGPEQRLHQPRAVRLLQRELPQGVQVHLPGHPRLGGGGGGAGWGQEAVLRMQDGTKSTEEEGRRKWGRRRGMTKLYKGNESYFTFPRLSRTEFL